MFHKHSRPKSISRLVDFSTLRVIEPCSNPRGYNSPVYAVRKKSGAVRIVLNLKCTLNKVLVELDPYPIPDMNELLTRIGKGNQYFASLDLRSGYWQVVIHPSDRHKFAFTWKGRCYMYSRLPMGLTSAGGVFSRAISDAFNTIPALSKQNIATYLDDNLVFGRTFEDFKKTLSCLFTVLRTNGLCLNGEKCTFVAKQAKFLGRVICTQGFRADPDYISGISNMTAPNTYKELQTLIGRSVDSTVRRTAFTS